MQLSLAFGRKSTTFAGSMAAGSIGGSSPTEADAAGAPIARHQRFPLGTRPTRIGNPMPNTPALTGDFDAGLETVLPRLRAYALSLTRDGDRADDLVQQTVLKSLAGRTSYRPGTNFGAWMIRIERNEFISGLRRERSTLAYDSVETNALSHALLQETRLLLRDLIRAFSSLSAGQREALLFRALEGWSYWEIAAQAAVSIGTVKSRIWHARAALGARLSGGKVRRTARAVRPIAALAAAA
jgi:RNA polymerase sigma-70 factor (ECF subfamily)